MYFISFWYLQGCCTGIPQNDELAEKYKKLAVEMQKELQTNKTLNFQQGIDSS